MVATRSKSKKTEKNKVLDAREISYNAACATLDINFYLCCKV